MREGSSVAIWGFHDVGEGQGRSRKVKEGGWEAGDRTWRITTSATAARHAGTTMRTASSDRSWSSESADAAKCSMRRCSSGSRRQQEERDGQRRPEKGVEGRGRREIVAEDGGRLQSHLEQQHEAELLVVEQRRAPEALRSAQDGADALALGARHRQHAPVGKGVGVGNGGVSCGKGR